MCSATKSMQIPCRLGHAETEISKRSASRLKFIPRVAARLYPQSRSSHQTSMSVPNAKQPSEPRVAPFREDTGSRPDTAPQSRRTSEDKVFFEPA